MSMLKALSQLNFRPDPHQRILKTRTPKLVASGIPAWRRGRLPSRPATRPNGWVFPMKQLTAERLGGFFRRAGKPGSTAGKDACRDTVTAPVPKHFNF